MVMRHARIIKRTPETQQPAIAADTIASKACVCYIYHQLRVLHEIIRPSSSLMTYPAYPIRFHHTDIRMTTVLAVIQWQRNIITTGSITIHA